jgi:hypothetical protein
LWKINNEKINQICSRHGLGDWLNAIALYFLLLNRRASARSGISLGDEDRWLCFGNGLLLFFGAKNIRKINIYAYVGNNPLIKTDPKGLACNGQGCWNTPQERDMANAGDYVGYYTTACANGDQYACQGLGVATDQGVLQGVTNYRLAWALSKNLPLGQTCKHDQEVIAQKMDLIRKALVKARADQLDALNASPDNPAQVDPQSIADFHHAIFTEYGAAPTVGGLPTFGCDLWGANAAMTITTGSGWCPSPACKQ